MQTKLIIIGLCFASCSLAPRTAAGDLYGMIMEGRLAEASDSLSRLATASTRDGNLIFFSALIEPDAEKSAQLLETALTSSIAHGYRQQVYYRLAHYYLLGRDYKNLSRILNEYRSTYETGAYEQEMLRLAVLVDQLTGNYESSQRLADRYSIRFNKGEADQWGQIDRARIMVANKKHIGAEKLLRELSRQKGGVGVPQSLYMLASDAALRGRTEDAVFYYNLLREACPLAIGLEALTDQLTSLSSDYRVDNTAEELTGTFYSIKVGVYSVRSNAQNQAKHFEDLNRPVETIAKNISGQKYHVVYVGRFKSYEEALEFKKHLEATQGEVFQVVAR